MDGLKKGLSTGALATVWLTLFLDLVAFGIILPVVPYYAERFDATPATVALLSSAFSLAQFVCAPLLGRISDRVGRRPVMLISIAGSVVAHLTLFFASSLTMIFVARVLAGMSNANVSTAHAYVADRVPARDRARMMGLMGSAIGLGFVLGPAIGGLLSTEATPALPFLVAGLLAALNLGMAWVALPESRPAHARVVVPRRRQLRLALRTELWKTPLFWLVVVNFGFFLVFASMESTFALYCEAAFGWGSRQTGLLYVVIGLAILLTQGVLVGRVVAWLGEKRTMLLGMSILALGLALCATAASVGVLALGAALIAVGNGLSTPSVASLISRVTRDDQQGWSQGLAQSAAALARIGAPAAAGTIFQTMGAGVPMLLGAVVLVLVFVPMAAFTVPQPADG